MQQAKNGLSDADLEALTRLHAATLRGSVLGELGREALADYYRWVAGSPSEHLFTEGAPLIGAAVLSLEPASVMRRFIASNPARFSMRVARAALTSGRLRRQMAALTRESLLDRQPHASLPEVLQIFADPAQQGRGIGARLLAQVEAYLRDRSVPEYCVHTFEHDNDAGLGFYRKQGFALAGHSKFCGDDYVLLTKAIEA